MDKKPRRLLLASSSKYRKKLLEQLHIPFETIDPRLDESPLKKLGLPPQELVQKLAQAKAKAVAHIPNTLVISGDQVAAIDGDILGKPGNVERAVEQLKRLAGRTHLLITALCVLDTYHQDAKTIVDVHAMTMRPLNEKQIRRYVDIDHSVDCAGAYKLESMGVALFEKVSGSDASAIVGIPLMHLVTLLAQANYDVFAHAVAK